MRETTVEQDTILKQGQIKQEAEQCTKTRLTRRMTLVHKDDLFPIQ